MADSTLEISLLPVLEKAALPFNDSVITMSTSGLFMGFVNTQRREVHIALVLTSLR